ncbi:hypothetical protein [Pilimelia columellifera]|uniref:CBM6 domain-containing protein n=1 Tax=Pilimelia columellifera subsp. columellifera TaxID=706583 RepID=A0ABN3N9K4_9ACTN
MNDSTDAGRRRTNPARTRPARDAGQPTPSRPATGRGPVRGDAMPGAHRSQRRFATTAMLLTGAVAATAVAVSAGLLLRSQVTTNAVAPTDPPTAAGFPTAPEPGQASPDDVLPTPSPSPSRKRSPTKAKPKPSRAAARAGADPVNVSIEAEAARNGFRGGVNLFSQQNASGGVIVGNLGRGNSLDVRASVPAAGEHRVTIFYVSQESRRAAISINGADIGQVQLPAFATNPVIVRSVSLPMTMRSGDNTINIGNPVDRAPAVDRVLVVR